MTSWDNHDGKSDPVKDIQEMIEKVRVAPYHSPVILHSPRCKAAETQDVKDCNCLARGFYR